MALQLKGILHSSMGLVTNGYGRGQFYLYICVLLILDTAYASDSRVPGRNQQARSTTPAGKIHLDRPLENLTMYEGEVATIPCDITGDPFPSYSWYKNNRDVNDIQKDDNRYDAKATFWGSRLRIKNLNRSDSGMYTCIGENMWGREETSAYLTVLEGSNPKKSNPRSGVGGRPVTTPTPPVMTTRKLPRGNTGYCRTYQGVACATISSNRTIFVTDAEHANRMENMMMSAVAIIGPSNPMSEACSQYAIPVLCHTAFPPCEQNPKPRPRRICKDLCLMLEQSVCKEEFAVARTDSSMSRLLPNCETLPEVGSPGAENCISIRPTVHPVNPPPKSAGGNGCYNQTGTHYQGVVQETMSGYTCQRWDSQWPHQHTINVQQPAETLHHNYCRNPDGSEKSPWCFTTDNSVRKQICNIPKCVFHAEKKVSDVVMILVPSIGVPVGVALLLLTICMCRRNKTTNTKPSKPASAAATSQVEMNALLAKQKPRAREFPISAIRFIQEMGEGTFGKVYKGELCGYYSDNTITTVVIKTMKPGADNKQSQDFRKEVELMTDMKHPNIICLLGVCLKDHPNCMLFEFLCNGDLHNYLNLNSPRNEMALGDKTGHLCVLGYQQLLHIAMQVASGMEYLASHRYVHRDLAARNILVGENLTVKISDFGLARDIYAEDYYRIENQVLPVRWMPPEALVYGSLTVESDIWSYGVVLWEIFSYGLQPYYGYSNQEVIEMIRSRQMLPCPEDSPPFMYTLMIECWQELPIRRPSFKEIHTRLIQWKGEAVMNSALAVAAAAPAINNYGYIQPAPPSQSSSTHNSNQAPSHHSSTGPSNNTGTTALSGSSHTSPPITSHIQTPLYNGGGGPTSAHMRAGPGGIPIYPPQHHHQPMSMPYPPPNSHVGGGHESVMYRGHHVPQQHYQGLYKKPSPPGSVTSHRSSSIQSSLSPASSVSNCKVNNVAQQGAYPYGGGFVPITNGHFGHPSEHYNGNNVDSHKMLLGSCKPVSNDSGMYIPDVRTSEI